MLFDLYLVVYVKKIWRIYQNDGMSGISQRIKQRLGNSASVTIIPQNLLEAYRLNKHQWHFFFTKKNHQSKTVHLPRLNNKNIRIGAVIRCCNHFPEQLLNDLALQTNPLCHVWLIGNEQNNHEDLAWKLKAWIDLNKDLPFGIVGIKSEEVASEVEKIVDYVLLIESGDRILVDTVFAFTDFPAKKYDFIYCDHDYIGEDYLHVEPSLKPDWSPDFLLCHDYIEGCLMLKSEYLSQEILNNIDDPSWAYKHLLNLDINKAQVLHIPRVLWSKRFTPQDNIEYFHAAAKNKIQKMDSNATIEIDDHSGYRSILWSIPTPPPFVSIIIATVGKLEYLIPCVNSIRKLTKYVNFEFIFIDNSRGAHPDGISWLLSQGLRVIECNEKFNWAKLNNIGATEAKGDLLLFLNDDVEIIDPEWLNYLVSNSCRPCIACVGTLLLYPSGLIQHAGVFLVDHGGGARHWFHGLEQNKSVYKRLDLATREVSALTGACLMVEKELFNALQGFNEDLSISQNDVDFCLRASSQGRRNLYVGTTKLIHHESVHRMGLDCSKDERRFWGIWRKRLQAGDQFHNHQFKKNSSSCEINYGEDNCSKVKISDQHRFGVNVVGYLTSEMGLGEAARGLLSSLEAASIPFHAINYLNGNPSRSLDKRWMHQFTDIGKYSKTIFMINADWLPTAENELRSRLVNQNYIIGYWAWELDQFPNCWQSSIDIVDEIWVASDHVLNGLKKITNKPIKVIPYGFDIDVNAVPGRQYYSIPDSIFVFLVMFDVNSIIERKNPYAAILAFQKAFLPNDENVMLIIKVNNPTPEILKTITEKTHNYKNIITIGEVMTRHEINGLISNCDVYLSLHRAEGFGMQIAEAMWFGKPSIATNYSGNTSFMSDLNSILIPYTIKKIGPGNAPYDENFYWADPDINCASDAMLKIYTDKNLYSNLSRASWKDVRSQLSSNTVGKKLIGALYK
jgi:GT2 family glycosyltransferase